MGQGKGLYGQSQGNESRIAGRHNGSMIGAEALLDSILVEGEILTTWTGFWQCGASASLTSDIARVRKEWLASYLEGGELANGKPLTESVYRELVERRIASLITRATFGNPGKGARRRRV
jgi:hypothetical protein